jgi:hypothetical protein
MSDFCGCLATTSFRVKDRDAFWADPDTQRVMKHASDQAGIFFENDTYFSFAWEGLNPDWGLSGYWDKEISGVDLVEFVQRHILPSDVCRIQLSGAEDSYCANYEVWVTSQRDVFIDGGTTWQQRLVESDLTKAQSLLVRIRSDEA